jgi:hypothetical protein
MKKIDYWKMENYDHLIEKEEDEKVKEFILWLICG